MTSSFWRPDLELKRPSELPGRFSALSSSFWLWDTALASTYGFSKEVIRLLEIPDGFSPDFVRGSLVGTPIPLDATIQNAHIIKIDPNTGVITDEKRARDAYRVGALKVVSAQQLRLIDLLARGEIDEVERLYPALIALRRIVDESEDGVSFQLFPIDPKPLDQFGEIIAIDPQGLEV